MGESTTIIFLQKSKFDLFSTTMSRVIEFKFVPEIVQDLEVINSELFENLIKLFVESNKIIPGEIIVVIADNAAFIEDINNPVPPAVSPAQPLEQVSPHDLEERIMHFIEHVPFDDVASLRFPINSGVKVWATNKILYTSIIDAFDKIGFEAKAVLPSIVFGGNFGSKVVLDPAMVSQIIQSADSVRQHNLISGKSNLPPLPLEKKPELDKKEEINSGEEVEIDEKKNGKKSNKRLFLMIGVFGILIIILIFVYLGSLSQTS